MRPPARVLDAVHTAALAVWLGVLVMTGASAAVIFPEMRDLDPRLPGFALYEGPHWLIAGGHIGQRVFFVSDFIQIVCTFFVVATYMPTSGLRLGVFKRGSEPVQDRRLRRAQLVQWTRFVILLALLLGMAYRLGVLNPSMADDLRAYWDAARAGDAGQAELFKAAFDAQHPAATRLMGAATLGVALLLILSIFTAALVKDAREVR